MADYIEQALREAHIVAVEAIFELDPFDREAQKDFEEVLDDI